MKLDKYTSKLQMAIAEAKEIAKSNNNSVIDGRHLLKAILMDKNSKSINMLEIAGVSINLLLSKLEYEISLLPKLANLTSVKISRDLARLFSSAEALAEKIGDKYVSSEIFIISLVQDSKDLANLLIDCGLRSNKLEQAFYEIKSLDDDPENIKQNLEKFTVNLVEKAEKGELDPVVGRDEEIRRVIQILQRRRKNNPVIIGEPGVGKSAIIEGLAQRIVNNEVPEGLKNKKILSLDLGLLIAGAKMRGEFEERLKGLLKAISKDDSIILFIDEIHTMVGAGKAEGSMDAGNMLKPALSRGEVRCIGATTLDEYRQYIEKDQALERRFQKVLAPEPSEQETIAILRGIKEKYEVHHGIEITDKAIVSAAKYSNRYIADRKLPDKAIDLIDEAGSMVRNEIESKPEEVDRLERRLIQLKIEKEALQADDNPEAQKNMAKINDDITKLTDEFNKLSKILEEEKQYLSSIQKAKGDLEQARIEMETYKRSGDLTKASEVQYGKIPQLEKIIHQAEENPREMELIRTSITEEEIAEIVSKATGIPITKMIEEEKDKLLKMEEMLHKRVVGQHVAIEAVSNAIRRSRAGIADSARPNGSFLFLGPTGVGKTELCKALAEFLFDSENAMIRLDMSEYMEKYSVSRLVGPPPGYVGYEEGGALTEAVRRKPYSLVLLDEVEKAHPDVFNILLQVLDDGRLTDSHGVEVDFKNTVIVLTSNLGSDKIQDLFGNLKKASVEKLQEAVQEIAKEKGEKLDDKISEKSQELDEDNAKQDDNKQEPVVSVDYNLLKSTVMEVVENHFRPEFLNRIDEIVVFHPLSIEQIRGIADYHIDQLNKRLQDIGMSIKLTEEAMNLITQYGYDPVYGARPLKRTIQKWLENLLSQQIIAGTFTSGMEILVDLAEDGDSLTFSAE